MKTNGFLERISFGAYRLPERTGTDAVGEALTYFAFIGLIVFPLPAYIISLIPVLLLALFLIAAPPRPLTPSDKQAAFLRHSLRFLIPLFFVYGIVDWAMKGAQPTGYVPVIDTLIMFVFYMAGARISMGSARSRRPAGSHPIVILLIICGFVCAVYALLQYFWLYDAQLAKYVSGLQNEQMSMLDRAIIYHLQLKRVASFFGDPNMCGLALTISALAALFRLFSGGTGKLSSPRSLAVFISLAVILIALPLTGSRSALVALFLGIVILACIFKVKVFDRKVFICLSVTVLSIAFGSIIPTLKADLVAGQRRSATAAHNTMFVSRVSTIKERLNYFKIGSQIFGGEDRLTGGGFGIVEQKYGLYKPAGANETKYLHNWPLQCLCEEGLIGLGILGLILALIYVYGFRSRIARPEEAGFFILLLTIYLIDGLWSLCATAPAHIALAALLVGLVIGTPPRDIVSRPPPPSHQMASRLLHALLLIVSFLMLNELSWHEYRYNLVREAIGNNDGATALKILDSIPSRSFYHDTRLDVLRAQALELTGRRAEARATLEPVLAGNTARPSTYAFASQFYAADRDFEKARAYARMAVESYPNNDEYRYNLSKVCALSDGHLTEAIDQAEQAVRLAGDERTKKDYTQWRDSLVARREGGIKAPQPSEQ